MTTGANFEVDNGRVLWYRSLIFGDELLIQDHEARAHSRQGTYNPHLEYGDPFVDTITAEISKTERDMRLASDMKQCALQDGRFIDCIVDPDSIVEEDVTMSFTYVLHKAGGGILEQEFETTA